MATNKRRRHTPDQIIRKLAEGNKLLGMGQELAEVCRHLEIAESTWHRWIAQYGGMKANEAKRLKELEAENARLKKLVIASRGVVDFGSRVVHALRSTSHLER